jgi:molybdopterin converting factor small subunit
VALVLIPRALRARTGGVERLEVDARDVRRLLAELERRFPGLGEELARDASVAIDGEIVADALLEPVGPESEVHFVPKIGGGA